jgi:6-phosphogluconolactonase (cycloisomerase 2 family)
MQRRHALAILVSAALAACSDTDATGPVASADQRLAASGAAVGGVFVSTNSASGNAVVAFARRADGSLAYAGSHPTGGLGVGGTTDPLVSQFALTLSRNAQLLFVVNAGSNSVTSFAVDGGRLTRVATVPSGGTRPVSVAASPHTLYVLHSGNSVVTTFDIGSDGTLAPRGGAVALSPGGTGPAAVRLSPDGRFLTVAERTSNTFSSFVVAADGSLGAPVPSVSAGAGPFGFDYTVRGQLVVSEAGSGSASSYAQAADGRLAVVSAAAPTLQRAPCWLIVDNAGRLAYTANAGSASLTGFAVGPTGALTRLTADGVSADLGAGAQPLDLDMSRNGRFLYVLKNGTGTIQGFAVANDGSLASLGDVGDGIAALAGYMGLAAY